MALPMAMTMFMPGMGAAFASKFPAMSGIFSGMNPMAANMLKQTALGYGTAALSGSKRPGKAAMYAGLASLPFSYMSASQAANAYNQQFAGEVPMVPGVTGSKMVGPPGRGFYEDVMGKVPMKDFEYTKMTPWDILSKGDAAATRAGAIGQELPTADIFSKTTPLKQVYDPQSGTSAFTGGEQVANWLPTAASQAAALYGGSMTPEEEWEESQKKRKKELAWMYGVPEDMVEGEMTNPWSTGSFWNRGGIASLENGGDVSGPGTGTSDSINANLSDGEFVMTAKAVENLGNGDRYAGARQMYNLMNVLDPESETMSEVV